MRNRLLWIMLLPILLFIGCGKTEKSENVQSLRLDKVVISNTLPGIENPLLAFEDFYETVIDAKNKMVYSVNPLEDVESATVSDGIYNITLEADFDSFVAGYGEEELPSDVGTNLIGSVEVNGIYHNFYFHAFRDFVLDTSSFNLLNGDNSGYYDYIKTIMLTTPRFQTSDGFRVGMKAAELEEQYGNGLMKDRENEYDGSYDYTYKNNEVEFRFHIDSQGIIESISISG